ncbi:MAG TPA: 2-hydroxyacid dehydrogenase [Clostridia bacterium]|nr:2-hydroxyacid dehydrogenase [Clostridia bacterium]
MKIAFFDTKDYDKELFDKFNENYNYEITYFESKLNKETAQFTKGFEVVCIFVNDTADKEVLKILEKNDVKILALRCAGFNNVDISNKGKIRVVRVPEYSPYAVAEHTIALLLNVNRKIYKAYQRVKKYNFSLDGLLGFDLHGKTVGVIGTGKIGKTFIKIMKGFGVNILAYDIFKDENSSRELDFKYVELEELLEKSDIISLHCPLSKDTEKIINSETISKMKNGVILLNSSRGKLIDTESLIEGMVSGKIGGAGLDVYENEEEFFLRDMSNSYKRDKNLSLLISMPNVIITSHQSFFTIEALNKIVKDTLQNIKEISETGNCKNEQK